MSLSDVNKRLPRFREIQNSIRETESQGGYTNVSPQIIEYLHNIQPVGVNEHNTIVLPDDYSPYDGPPVLALKPREDLYPLRIKGGAAEARAAEHLAAQYGLQVSVSERNLKDRLDYAGVASVGITRIRKAHHSFALPRVIIVSHLAEGDIMAHEADHWDFSLSEEGAIKADQNNRYNSRELRAISEKRAYDTSLEVNRSLGKRAILDNYDSFREYMATEKPRNRRTFKKAIQQYGEKMGLPPQEPSADVAALAIRLTYGQENVPLTKMEYQVYKALGLS